MKIEKARCKMCGSGKHFKNINNHYKFIVECTECGFMQSLFDTHENMPSVQSKPIPGFSKFLKLRHFQIAQLLIERSCKCVLEVGTGYGGFAFLSNFYDMEVYGIEPDQVRLHFSEQVGNINIVDSVEKLQPEMKFDAVVIDNVLEHVKSIKKELQAVYNLLRPGGIVVIIVPNRYDVRRISKKWSSKHYWLEKDHLSYFRVSDLDGIMQTQNFNFVEPFHYGNWMSRALKRLSNFFGITPFGIARVYMKKDDR